MGLLEGSNNRPAHLSRAEEGRDRTLELRGALQHGPTTSVHERRQASESFARSCMASSLPSSRSFITDSHTIPFSLSAQPLCSSCRSFAKAVVK